jgi:hypothetical protein
MQIPSSAGMLVNSVLPVTPMQGGLPSQVGETAGSTSFAPVAAVSNISISRSIPDQRAQPETAPENVGRSEITPVFGNENSANKTGASEQGADPRSAQDGSAQKGSASIQNQSNENSERSERSENESKQQVRIQEQQQQQDLKLITSLSQRDREVQAHENAHSVVAGQYAGSANYTYQRGPDGVNYAVGGEVPIDVGIIQGNPAATLEKMQLIQRAALAPAEPSSQDRNVAAIAVQQANQARAEIVIESLGGSSSAKTSAADKSGLSIEKMQLVQSAALVPAEPSSQNSKVAAIAVQQASQAGAEAVLERRGGSSFSETSVTDKPEPTIGVAKDATQGSSQSNTEDSSQSSELTSQSDADSENFQAANDRLSKINEIIVAISQNDTSKAAGQLLDAIV